MAYDITEYPNNGGIDLPRYKLSLRCNGIPRYSCKEKVTILTNNICIRYLRKQAKALEWAFPTVNHHKLDLCPQCAKHYKEGR